MINMFLESYGYASSKELLLSICPSWKYGLGWEAISVSAILAFMSEMLGITPILLVGMFVAVVLETITGTKASLKQGKDFESWRFSRCVFKVSIWVGLFFVFHSFEADAEMKEGVIWVFAALIYSLFHATTMIYFAVEYATSIAENMAILDGKAKDAYISALKDMFASILENLKNRIRNEKN